MNKPVDITIPTFPHLKREDTERVKTWARQLLLEGHGLKKPTFLTQDGDYLLPEWHALTTYMQQHLATATAEYVDSFCELNPTDPVELIEAKRRFLHHTIEAARTTSVAGNPLCSDEEAVTLHEQLQLTVPTTKVTAVTPAMAPEITYTPGQFISRLLFGKPLEVSKLTTLSNRTPERAKFIYKARVLQQISIEMDDFRLRNKNPDLGVTGGSATPIADKRKKPRETKDRRTQKDTLEYTVNQMVGFFGSQEPLPKEVQEYLTRLYEGIPLEKGFWAKKTYTEADASLVKERANVYIRYIKNHLSLDGEHIRRLHAQHEVISDRGKS